ncbi:deoxynucleoside triphosphate triphosphohydrolase SAMHD1-like isoform X1 [Biomphalaria glabrata]|uniref:Deoxynucleoside triphosphate triphosphohydrolase SAMHD1-like isoform X1 n=3 Tax=Biomphalaria glabrata TaxID=6526 RepID=A0A9W3AUQ7_BIOGL|nr:deoxynucleoside triphosphate triphosphohydrolase SAMHD1-like isoform X1 [Biomphalaria glabrata]
MTYKTYGCLMMLGDTPIQTVIDDLKTKKANNELIKVLKKLRDEVKHKTKLKHIMTSLNAHELMNHKPTSVKSYQDCQFLFDYLNEEKKKRLAENNCPSSQVLKIFNDPIHGHIQLHPACQMIVDTPEFQRLRDIKQLGTVYFVYPGAAHNRFEHSLGVCHLAEQFVKSLHETQPELGITDVDQLCVQIAGLCVNLGHGPFSRVYFNHFLPAIHEKTTFYRKPSAAMFRHLLKKNNLETKLAAYGIKGQDIDFIIEQIEGPKHATGSTGMSIFSRAYHMMSSKAKKWPYKGRPKEKAYLYEIVVNRRNGIDVYKWDYMARDCHHLGIKNNFDASRYMKFARVIEMEGEIQICTRDKEISNLYNMFYTRYTVDKYAYSHKVACGIEIMIVDALKKANEHIRFKGENGEEHTIYECHNDMVALSQLTDYVLTMITSDNDEEPTDHGDFEKRKSDLEESRDIIQRIYKRDLYTLCYETQPMIPNNLQAGNSSQPVTEVKIEEVMYQKISEPHFKKEILTILQQSIKEKKVDESIDEDRVNRMIEEINTKKEIIVKKINLDFGMKEENPVERLKVYSKHNLNSARHLKKEEASIILGPTKFNEILVRVYSKDKDAKKCRILYEAARATITVKKESIKFSFIKWIQKYIPACPLFWLIPVGVCLLAVWLYPK